MRRIRYAVATSLDGYIAGPNGEADWIIMDPEIDFRALFKQFDTILVGRRTFEGMTQAGNALIPGMKTVVFSRTLSPHKYPGVTIVAEKVEEAVSALRAESGKDMVIRRRSAFSQFLGGGACGHGGSRGYPRATWRGDSAASDTGQTDQAETNRAQSVRYRHCLVGIFGKVGGRTVGTADPAGGRKRLGAPR